MDDCITKPVKPEERRRALDRGAPSHVQEPPPAGTDAADPPALDLEIIAALRALQEDGEPDFVTELIDVLLADMPGRLAALETALGAGQAVEVGRLAHSMKSSTGNLGALTLSGLLAALERQALDGHLQQARGMLLDVVDEYARARTALIAERQTPPKRPE